MPHLVLEYTRNINRFDAAELLPRLNEAMLESGQFEEGAIKSRAIEHKYHALGMKNPRQPFVHLTVSIMPGRSAEVRQALANSLMEVLRRGIAGSGDKVAASVEIRELAADAYVKAVIE